MKHQKPQGATSKQKKRASITALEKYLDEETTLIHNDLKEFKNAFLTQTNQPHENELPLDTKNMEEFYNSADDLFKQVALEMNGDLPLEAQWYETFILRKKKKSDKKKGS